MLGAVTNKTMLIIFMVVLIVFIVLMTALAIVFIAALRKRAPVVKVIMAPTAASATPSEPAPIAAAEETAVEEKAEPEPEPEEEDDSAADQDDGDEESVSFVTEGEERVRYDRSVTAKIIQLKDESKEWYSQLKNEILSYGRVKDRMSWKRETFRLGRMPIARIIVRGRTLCLLLAVDPSGFAGTKFAVEDVGHIASMVDTPCLYRIKSGRRIKYAKEMLAAVMTELGIKKQPNYEAQDYFMPYVGNVGLMQQGLVKRVVSGSTRTFEIREVDKTATAEAEAAATDIDDKGATE